MARVVDFEDGFTSETAPTDNDIATQAELDAHLSDTSDVHAATSLTLPATQKLYVDKGRADTYTATGSILKPYKTIQAAINAIQTAADNTDSKPYRIEISAGYYAEDLVISGANFLNFVLDGHGAVSVDKLTMSVHNDLWTFVCLGMNFTGSTSIIGATDGGTAFAAGGEFRNCNFYAVTLKNLTSVYIKDSAISGPLVVENVVACAIQKGQATGTIANTWAAANPKPGGAPYSYLTLEALVTTGAITVSAGAYLQTRIGSRIGLPGGTITVNGEFIAYSSYIRAGISVGATGVFTNSGSFYDPSTLSVAGGGTFTNTTKAETIANVPSGNLAATDVQAALNELQTDIDSTRPINKGGTGQITANAALNALLPSQASAAGKVLTSDGTNTSFVAPAVAPDSVGTLINLGLATSVASNAMTVALKQGDGSTNATAGAPVKIPFRSSTITSGAFNVRSVTAALSVVISSGATLGQSSAVAAYIYVYAIDNAGTVELAVSSTLYDEGTVVTTTAMSGSATDFFTVYSTSARTSVPLRNIGRIRNSQTTAGTYAANAIELSLPPFFTGRQIVVGGAQTTDGTYTAGTFGAPTNQPFVTLSAGKTGRYKISLSGAWTNSTGSTRIGARILASAGSPVVVFSQEATMDISAGMAGSPIPFNVYQVVWLTAGTLYTFALQGIISAGAGTLTFRQSPQASGVAMIAEQMD